MAIKDEILEFVKEAEYKIATLNDEITEANKDSTRNSIRFAKAIKSMSELSFLIEVVLITDREIVDENMNEVLNFSDMTDAETRQLMSDAKAYYNLVVSPYADLPFVVTPYIVGTSDGAASSLPSGGLPGWHLVLNSSLVPVWEPMPSTIDGGTL